MGYVFISYSSKEQDKADAMKKVLEKNDIRTWMAPGDIPAGSKYAEIINRAIKECACVILMLSEASQGSVWVAKEVERAVHYHKPIIPVQLENVVLNDEFEFYISTDHIVALQKIDENASETQKVISAVSAILGRACVSKLSMDDCGKTELCTTSNIQYRISFSNDDGSLFLYSADSKSKSSAVAFCLPKESWTVLVEILQEFVALFYHTGKDYVVVTLLDSLENKKCAPLDGYSYYDKEFRINFKISFITDNPSPIYNSFRIDVSNMLSLFFYNKGSYSYHGIPAMSGLSDIGVDEEECLAVSKELLQFLNPNKEIVVGKQFDIMEYSDLSSGYKLRFLAK